MKRGKPLRADPATVRAWQDRSRRRLPAKGAKAKREEHDEAAFRATLRERSGGACEITSPDCPPGAHTGRHAHHIYPGDRDRGVHDPDRGLYVCGPAHAWIHVTGLTTYAPDGMPLSYAYGWLGRG